ncbi:hypothetical protein J4E83_009749 [Alternaria metachromatica]|uniref:uncharacterized protein n=1 Tax=Alternaria metachromatica TaxID=283354 RepID=UPI0020C37881|nr:uncharacterized protein J4E83_009749 [Alternaria metachromatica]KAI4606994.1 hypothetical protein J4E83_009749 [Alternaria metachromatica]
MSGRRGHEGKPFPSTTSRTILINTDKDSPQASRVTRPRGYVENSGQTFDELEEVVVADSESSTLSPASPPSHPEQEIERAPQPTHAPSPKPQRETREASVDSQDGYHTPSEFPGEEREPAASSQEQPTRPHGRPTTSPSPPELQSRPGTNTAPPLSRQEERSLDAIPQDQTARLHEARGPIANNRGDVHATTVRPPSEHPSPVELSPSGSSREGQSYQDVAVREPPLGSTDAPITIPQADTEHTFKTSKVMQFVAAYGSAQQRPNLIVDFSTPLGQRQMLALIQDFASWWASNGGCIKRGNLGLEMPDLAGLLFPQYDGLTTMIMSKQSTHVPQPIRQRLDEVFWEGMLFWFRTSEYAVDPKQVLGDKCGLTAHGKALSGWRICLVQKVFPNVVLVTWGRTSQGHDLDKIHPGNRWQFMRLLPFDRRGWPEDVSRKHSPHDNILMHPKEDEGWSVQELKTHCNFNVLVANEVIPTQGFIFAGYLTDDSLGMVKWVRNAAFVGLAELKYMPPTPLGVDEGAVRRGLEDNHYPRQQPTGSIKPKLFPAAYRMPAPPPYVPAPGGEVFAFQDAPSSPQIPNGPRGTGGGRPRDRPARGPGRQRSRSRSPLPRERQADRNGDYARGYPGRSAQPDQPIHQQEGHDRPADTRLGDNINRPVFMPVNNVMQDGRYQPHVIHNHASRDHDDNRNPERENYEDDRGRDRAEQGGEYQHPERRDHDHDHDRRPEREHYEDDGGRGRHEQGGEYQNGDLLNYG